MDMLFVLTLKIISVNFEYLQIVSHKTGISREHIDSLMSITRNSPFLNNTNAEWLDTFKSEASNFIIDTVLNYIDRSQDDSEFQLHLTNCIFLFDAVSEEALKIQCRLLTKQGKHSLAKKAYSKFIKEYSGLYDEEFSLSFNEIIEEN